MRLRKLATWLVVFGFLLGGGVARQGTAQPAGAPIAALPPQAERAIAALAERSLASRRSFALILNRHGFPPTGWQEERWRKYEQMTPQELMGFAWRAAEKAKAGSGLALLQVVWTEASSLYPGLRSEQGFKEQLPPQGGFKFATLVEQDLAPPLPPDVETIIRSIEKYVEPNLRVAMRRCCNPSEAEFTEYVRTSKNPADAIRRALRAGKVPPELVDRLARLLETITVLNPASANLVVNDALRSAMQNAYRATDPTLSGAASVKSSDAAYAAIVAALDKQVGETMRAARAAANVRPEDMPHSAEMVRLAEGTPDDFGRRPFDSPPASSTAGPGPIVPPSGGGGSPGRTFEAAGGAGRPLQAARNTGFDLAHATPGAPSGVRPSFGSVARVMMGRGGVVFGAPVKGAPELESAVFVAWTPLPGIGAVADRVGAFRITLGDGQVAYSPPLPASEAAAAVRLVFTGLPGVAPPHSENEAMGFVGFTGRFVLPTVSGRKIESPTKEAGLHFVVDPLIADTPIGTAAMVTDAILIGDSAEVRKAAVTRGQERESPDNQFEAWYRAVAWVTYRWVDRAAVVRKGPANILRSVPVEGTEPSLHLDLFRFPIPSTTADPANSVGVLTEPTAPKFSALLTLVKGSEEVARINRFVEVLHVLRWAKSSGGVWQGGLDSRALGVVQTAILVDGALFHLLPSREAAASDVVRRVHEAGLSILQDAKASTRMIAWENRIFQARTKIIAVQASLRLMDDAMVAVGSELAATEMEAYRRATAAVRRRGADSSTLQTERAARADALQKLIARLEASPEAKMMKDMKASVQNLREADPAFSTEEEFWTNLRAADPASFRNKNLRARIEPWMQLQQEYGDACPLVTCTETSLR